MNTGIKEQLLTELLSDEDIHFCWCILTAELDEDDAEVALKYLVTHWVTIHGFSFAISVMEMYKQAQKNLFKGSRITKGTFLMIL